MTMVLALFLDEITRESFKESFGKSVNAEIRRTYGPDICARIVNGGIARGTRRGETREEEAKGGESYSAGLTAQPRRESCQFRSDPRVRVPETAGLALVSTHPSGLSLDYSRGFWSDEFSRLFFLFTNAVFYQSNQSLVRLRY